MKATVTRQVYTAESVTGMLDLDGVFQCYSEEPPQRAYKPCCIPEGTYDVKMQWSNRFQRVTPHLQNVPGFSEIEWHNGNFPGDTDGCTLVGQTRTANFVGNSVAALDALLSKLPAEFTVEYVDAISQGVSA